MSEIKALQQEIGDWADSVFPNRTIQSAALKLYEEIGEMLRDPSNEDEHADIYIMMFDLSRMYGIDVAGAVRRKMMRNKRRKWEKTATGTLQHTGEDDLSWIEAYNIGITDFQMGKAPDASAFDAEMQHYYMKGYNDAGSEDEGSTKD